MRYLLRDGVRLTYERREGARAPILFVHGWCCDHTYFAPQVEWFTGRGHGVVAVDLRGHGESDQPRQSYAMSVFADDLAWMIGQLKLATPIVVGHSMGGIVAYDFAIRYPGLPAAVVMIDAAVALPAAALGLIAPFLELLRGPDYRAALRRYVETALFIPTDDPERKTRILDGMSSAPQHVLVSAFEGLRDYEAQPGLAVPGLYIAAGEPTPRSDMSRLQVLAPDLVNGRTVGAGHFCQLEVPEQVNAMIERFLINLQKRNNEDPGR